MNAVKIYGDALDKLEHSEITLGEFDNIIKPLEDVEIVKHAKWVGKLKECSSCGCVCESYVGSPYCAWCGAKMSMGSDE